MNEYYFQNFNSRVADRRVGVACRSRLFLLQGPWNQNPLPHRICVRFVSIEQLTVLRLACPNVDCFAELFQINTNRDKSPLLESTAPKSLFPLRKIHNVWVLFLIFWIVGRRIFLNEKILVPGSISFLFQASDSHPVLS